MIRDVSERSPGITYQELLDQDTHPVPDVLRLESTVSFGPDEFPITRYTTREWHEVEKEKLWSRYGSMLVERTRYLRSETTTSMR